MIWRFIPGFGDDYTMTKTGEVKHLLSGHQLELLTIGEHGETGYLLRDAGISKIVPLIELYRMTYPERLVRKV